MANRINIDESMIKLVQRCRFETDETKLPSDFDKILHPAGGKFELGYYENAIVCGFRPEFWEFPSDATWKDLIKALQTTHKHCQEIVGIFPNY